MLACHPSLASGPCGVTASCHVCLQALQLAHKSSRPHPFPHSPETFLSSQTLRPSNLLLLPRTCSHDHTSASSRDHPLHPRLPVGCQRPLPALWPPRRRYPQGKAAPHSLPCAPTGASALLLPGAPRHSQPPCPKDRSPTLPPSSTPRRPSRDWCSGSVRALVPPPPPSITWRSLRQWRHLLPSLPTPTSPS